MPAQDARTSYGTPPPQEKEIELVTQIAEVVALLLIAGMAAILYQDRIKGEAEASTARRHAANQRRGFDTVRRD